MPCPFLLAAIEELNNDVVISLDDESMERFLLEATADRPSVDRQRLRAFYALEFMLLQIYGMKHDFSMSASGLTEIIDKVTRIHRDLVVRRGLDAMSSTKKVDKNRRSTRDSEDAVKKIIDSAAILRTHLNKDVDLPKKVGTLFGEFLRLQAQPSKTFDVIRQLFLIDLNNRFSP